MIFAVFGTFTLLTVAGAISLTVTIYNVMPPNLASTLRFIFDYVLVVAEVLLKLAYITILFMVNIVNYVLQGFLQIFPYFITMCSALLSFFVWICTNLLRGVLGIGDKATNTLSWLFIFCAVYLYFDHKGYFGFNQARTRNTDVDQGHHNQQQAEVNTGARRNNLRGNMERRPHNRTRQRFVRLFTNRNTLIQGPRVRIEPREPRPIEPERLSDEERDNDDAIQQLEAENRENENEANAQEEAVRTRMQDDNVRNAEREQFEEAEPFRVEDTADASLCVICLDRERNVAVFPCGHTQLCLVCVQRLRERNGPCPICQQPFDEFRQVFV